MLFGPPALEHPERAVLEAIEDVRQRLKRRLHLHEPRRWYGSLRRSQFARAVQGSNSIEGYTAAVDDTAAIDLGAEPFDANEETRLAIKGYRDAMTYVLQLTSDEAFVYSEQLIKSLHFMMTGHDLHVRPGLWRPGAIFVRNEATGEVVYEGADIDAVPRLTQELVEHLNAPSDVSPMVRAAMAHLDLVMIHPFRDGNGRMARCLQTLVLAREGILTPVFCSIEEYLGRNTEEYYRVLSEVGGSHWQPERDARPWVRFCLTAHLRQAETTLRRVAESERLWEELEKLVLDKGLHGRTIPLLWDAAMGFRVRNATYRAMHEDEITDQVAGRDLRLLVQVGLLVPHGEKRGRFYTAAPELQAKRREIVDGRGLRDDADPFA